MRLSICPTRSICKYEEEEEEIEIEMQCLSHFVVEGDLLIGRGFVCGENTADNVGSRSGAADVGQLVVAEGFDGSVEIGGGLDREVSKEDGSARAEPVFEPRLLLLYRVCETREVEFKSGIRAEDGWEGESVYGFLLW